MTTRVIFGEADYRMTTCDSCGRIIGFDDADKREGEDGTEYFCGECWSHVENGEL